MANRPRQPPTPGFWPRISTAWQRGLLTLNELAVHLVVVVGLVGAVKLFELIVSSTTHGEGLVFFKGNPYFEFSAQWFFDAADIALIVSVLCLGVYLVFRTYKGTE